jgi:hypothetical protein
LNSGNTCYHSIQSLLSSHLLSKNVKIKIYKVIILPVVLYWCETWSLTLREHRLRVFENWVLRRIFGPKRDEVRGGWKKTAQRGASKLALFIKYNQNDQVTECEIGGACSTNEGEEELVQFIDGKARGKGNTRKIKTWVGG